MKKNRKLDAPRMIHHAAVTLESAAHDLEDTMQCLRGTLRDVDFAVQDRSASVAALEREADAFRANEQLRRFFVSAAVDARNGYDLSVADVAGVREALRVAYDAVESVKQQRARIDAAVDAAEKQLAEAEYKIAEIKTPCGGKIDLDELMPDEVAERVSRAFDLRDADAATVGDALAAIAERVKADTTARAAEWIAALMHEENE